MATIVLRACSPAPPGREQCTLLWTTYGEIKHTIDRFRRQSGTVVGHCDAVSVKEDGDLGGCASFFASVECVVDQLLEHHDGPVASTVADLRSQPFLAREIEKTASSECCSLKFRCESLVLPFAGC
jgi:hypothetical protein